MGEQVVDHSFLCGIGDLGHYQWLRPVIFGHDVPLASVGADH
jgi:hypothetical protein